MIGASIAGRVTAALVSGAGASDSETISAIASANLSDVVGSVLWVAAAVLGILVVRSTTRLVQQSPHAPVSAAA